MGEDCADPAQSSSLCYHLLPRGGNTYHTPYQPSHSPHSVSSMAWACVPVRSGLWRGSRPGFSRFRGLNGVCLSAYVAA